MANLEPNSALRKLTTIKRFTLRDFLDSQAHPEIDNAPGRFSRNLDAISHFLTCCKLELTHPAAHDFSCAMHAMDALVKDLVDTGNEFFSWRAQKQGYVSQDGLEARNEF